MQREPVDDDRWYNGRSCRRLGVNVYLIDGGSEFLLIDIGYLDSTDEVIDLIRRMDFNLSHCKMVIATHADADHIQGLARAKELLKTKAAAHPLTKEPLESGDEILTYATIKAQDFSIPMPCCKVDILLNDGDVIEVGNQKLKVWHTPGHRQAAVLRRQHLQGQLRRRHRCTPRLEHS
jgi:glyoxylase-like metal-dependent hydrolase (beta-lactamase superfamily II)